MLNFKYTPTFGYQRQYSLEAPAPFTPEQEDTIETVEESPEEELTDFQLDALYDIGVSTPDSEFIDALRQTKNPKEAIQRTAEYYSNPDNMDKLVKYNNLPFKDKMLRLYRSALKEKGIDPTYAEYLVAQDYLESAGGTKHAGKHNYGNIIAINTQKGTVGNDTDGKGKAITQKFRDFDTVEDFINSKISLLSGKRYQAFTGDIKDFFARVKAGGYATDPDYVKKLTKVYNQLWG